MGKAQARGRLRTGDGAAVHPLHLNRRSFRNAGALGRRIRRAPLSCLAADQPLPARAASRAARSRGPTRRGATSSPRDEALDLAERSSRLASPIVAFGGGEPLGVPPMLGDFRPAGRGGRRAQARDRRQPHRRGAAERSRRCAVQCVQISVDGATAATHERVRPGRALPLPSRRSNASSRAALAPQFVFVPTRLNVARDRRGVRPRGVAGCGAFVTGPMMRIGRAAPAIGTRSRLQRRRMAARGRCAEERARRARGAPSTSRSIRGTSSPRWRRASSRRRRCCCGAERQGEAAERAAVRRPRTCAATRSTPRGTAYRDAWRTPEVRDFVVRCRAEPALLRHANETWPLS